MTSSPFLPWREGFRQDCGKPDCGQINDQDITPSTGAHLVFSGKKNRSRDTPLSLPTTTFEVIKEIALTTSKILTVNGYDEMDRPDQVCTGAKDMVYPVSVFL